MTARERDFHFAGSLPRCSHELGLGWARWNLGAWISIWVSYIDGRDPITRPLFCFPRCISRKLGKRDSSKSQSCILVWDMGASNGNLVPFITMPDPPKFFYTRAKNRVTGIHKIFFEVSNLDNN